MAWLADADVKQAVADYLQTPAAGLQSYWDRRVTAANVFAKNVILDYFADLGIDTALAPTWDRAQEFQRDLALWYLGQEARGMFSEADALALAKKDRRQEMAGLVVITVGGVTVWPTVGDSASLAVGTIAIAAVVPPTCFRDTRRDPLIRP